jgi:hypothetical protein
MERIERSRNMKSFIVASVSLAAISAVISSTAFAEGGQGIGRAGTYLTQTTSSTNEAPKTRAQVRAELAAAYSDGSLPALNRNSYPSRSMWGDAVAAQAEARNRGIVEYANGSPVRNNVVAR